jgi:hypothetical protein
VSAGDLTRELRMDSPPADLSADAPIPVTIATAVPLQRYGVVEVLDCSPEGCDLSRAPLPMIVAHDTGRLAIGLVENLVASGDKVTGTARFGTSPEAQQVRADVLAGIHQHVSVGYCLLGEGTPTEGGAIFRWQPHEVSVVSVPADQAAGFFRSLSGANSMTAAATQTRESEINALCRSHRVETLAAGMIQRGISTDLARREILEALAQRDDAAGGRLNVRARNGGDDEAARIVNTLTVRLGGRVNGETIAAGDCISLAARALGMTGQRISDSDSRSALLQRALTTSDFPNLLGTAVGRVLVAAYAAAPAALKTISRLANVQDFRAKTAVRLGPTSALEKVNEHGEFKYGSIAESANSWKLSTWGKILSLSRQALINDDLGGFADLVAKFGQAAARLEAAELTAILTTPPNVDGSALFAAGRNNLLTGAGSALALAAIGSAVKALRSQTDLDGSLVGQEPATILVPAALEMTARQLVASITPAQAANVQPYGLSVAVEPRLDAASTTAWYLVAGNQSALEYGYLEGADGVQVSQREGFEIDGLEIKARLDFGCGWVSPVGWVKNAGV